MDIRRFTSVIQLVHHIASANSIILYELTHVWGGHSKYKGPPSPKVDTAWTELLLGKYLAS